MSAAPVEQRREPLLSICIPTYNRARFLRIMLEALIPQAEALDGLVEVIVSDNASTDDTKAVVESAQGTGTVVYSQNAHNLGPLANIVKPATELATGKYVWVLGDHNLLKPAALARVVDVLTANPDRRVFYANFVCARYPEDWPDSAMSGYDGHYEYPGNASTTDHPVDRWSRLVLGGRSALGTQSYAHIVEQSVWHQFWKGREVDSSFSSALSTYPHTVMITETLFDAESYYIGKPVLTIFNGAQSWGTPELKRQVYFKTLPELLRLFSQRGLPLDHRTGARKFASLMAAQTSSDLFATVRGAKRVRLLVSLLKDAARNSYLIRPVWRSFRDSRPASRSVGQKKDAQEVHA